MTGFFDFSEPPLSTLDAGERQRLRQAVDVARFQQNEVLRESGEQWSHMYLVLRGRVEAQAQDESGGSRLYGPDELVGPRDFVNGDTSRRFVALEETACLSVGAETVADLVKDNKAFRQAMSGEFSSSLRLDASRTDSDTFALARVEDATIRRAVVFPADTPAAEGVTIIRRREADCILVRGDRGIGMVTGTDLLKAAESDDGLATPMGRIASWDLISIGPDDYLFDALIRPVFEALDGGERVLRLDAEFLEGFADGEDPAACGRITATGGAAQLQRLAGDDTELIVALQEGVFIRHPGHDLGVGMHVGGGHIAGQADVAGQQVRLGQGNMKGDLFRKLD